MQRAIKRLIGEYAHIVGAGIGQSLGQRSVVIANQFLHHFTPQALQAHLPGLVANTRVLLISDLHRHPVAHAGFRAAARLFRASPIAYHDGLVSIRRGFTRSELEALIAVLSVRHSFIEWCFPFRYEVALIN